MRFYHAQKHIIDGMRYEYGSQLATQKYSEILVTVAAKLQKVQFMLFYAPFKQIQLKLVRCGHHKTFFYIN